MAANERSQGADPQMSRWELPLVGDRPASAERADAARNRERILEAAARLFAQRGVEQVGMDDVAREACVGKGTLYRRFGDQAGLALALLDERERALQLAAMQGSPPLGPGAPPAQRLAAFLAALLDHVEANLDLLHLAQRRGDRFGSPPYRFHRLHVALLIGEAAPDADAEALADLLLAGLAADVVRYQRVGLGWPRERIAAAVARLAHGVTAGAPDRDGGPVGAERSARRALRREEPGGGAVGCQEVGRSADLDDAAVGDVPHDIGDGESVGAMSGEQDRPGV